LGFVVTLANVAELVVADVIEVECFGIRVVAAVNAAAIELDSRGDSAQPPEEITIAFTLSHHRWHRPVRATPVIAIGAHVFTILRVVSVLRTVVFLALDRISPGHVPSVPRLLE